QHGFTEQVAGLVIAPQECADFYASLGATDALHDRLERDIARPEHAQLGTVGGARGRVEWARQADRLHLPRAAGASPASPEGGATRSRCTTRHTEALRVTQSERSVNLRQSVSSRG